jgi:deoxyribodipyrimidine photolyase-related protein
MKRLCFIMGDQLTRALSSLRDLEPGRDHVLMVEVVGEAQSVRHHKQKIAMIFSAMRHFAQALSQEGIAVDYVRLDDPENTGAFSSELARAVARHKPDRVIIT